MMYLKQLLFIFLIMPCLVHAQCDFSTNEVDEFTGVRKQITKSQTVCISKPDFIDLSIGKFCDSSICETYVTVSYRNIAELGSHVCISHDSYLYLLFNDGSSVKLTNTVSDIQCDHSVYASFKVDDLSKLNKKLKKIRIGFSDTYKDYEMGVVKRNMYAMGQSKYDATNFFIDAIKCVD